MFTLIVAVVIICVSFAYFHLTFGKYRSAINKIPGPPTLPVIGNVLSIGKTPAEMLQSFFKWWKQYGKDKFRVWNAFLGGVFITNPKDIEAVLSSTKILMKSDIYNLMQPWLGQGLLTSHGALWHSHRKMITPSFHFKILVEFFETMNTNSTKFMDKLEHISKGNSVFDFQSIVCNFTLDVICETAMGVSINAMDKNNSEIVKAFIYMCYSVQMRVLNPLKKNNFLFKFTPEYSQYKNALNTLKDFTMDVISKRRHQALQNATDDSNSKDDADDSVNVRRKKAFLDTLLTATIDGRPLTDKEIFEEVSTFMFEGHDTTSSGISFAMHLLSRHPEVQKKVFEEQQQIFGGDMTRQPLHSDVQEMKYLDMVIKEAQRIYPSVPFIGRYTDEPFDLNGLTLPVGTMVNMFLFAMGYNEKYFPDPYKFDPERFNPESRVKASPYEYVPFSAGPRNCIGQKFAMLEMKSTLAKIVRAFEVLPPEDGLYSKDGYEPTEPKNKYDPILSAVLTLKSENGIKIRLRKRPV